MKRLWWSVGIVCVLVVVGFLAFAVMQVRQVSRWFHYQQASPTVRITSRSYSEPSDNGFSNLDNGFGNLDNGFGN